MTKPKGSDFHRTFRQLCGAQLHVDNRVYGADRGVGGLMAETFRDLLMVGAASRRPQTTL